MMNVPRVYIGRGKKKASIASMVMDAPTEEIPDNKEKFLEFVVLVKN